MKKLLAGTSMKHITLLFSLGTLTSLKAMDQAPLQEALATIAQQNGFSDKKTVLGILNPKNCTLRATLLDAQLQASNQDVVNTQDRNGNSLLMQEISGDCNPDIIRVLLKHKVDPRKQNKDRETALHLLLKQVKNAKEKLYGAHPHTFYTLQDSKEEEEGEFYNYSQVLDLLLKHPYIKKYINLANKDHESPLIYALQNSFSEEVIEKLFYAGAHIHAKAKDGSSVIHLTARNYKKESRNKLIELFITVDQAFDPLVPLIDGPNNIGITPLMEAMFPKKIIKRGYLGSETEHLVYDEELVTTLLKYHPNLYAVDSDGQTALYKLLISHDDWLGNHKYYGYYDAVNQSTLIEAREKILDTLLIADSQKLLVNITDKEGSSPLMAVLKKPSTNAFYGKHTFDHGDYMAPYSISTLIKKLIDNGADVLHKNNVKSYQTSDKNKEYGGDNFVNNLVKGSHWLFPVFHTIIEAIPAHQRLKVINQPDCNGNTPVMNAVGQRYQYISTRHSYGYREDSLEDRIYLPLKGLLTYGADPNIKNNKGNTPLDRAFTYENRERENRSNIYYDRDPNPEWYTSILWKYNPANKWNIFRKNQPLYFCYSITKKISVAGLAAYGAYAYLASKFPFDGTWQAIKNLRIEKAT